MKNVSMNLIILQWIWQQHFLKYCSLDSKRQKKKDMEFGDTGAEEAGMVRLFINIGKKTKRNREISWAQLPVKVEFREN